MTTTSSNPQIVFAESGTQPVQLMYTDYDNYRSPAGLKLLGSQGGEWFEVAGNVYGAGFVKTSSSNSYVLLGGGGHKLVSDFATSGHTHSYLPLSGGTLSSGTARISRAGSSVAWYQGRANAMMYISSYSGYNAIASMKTTNGDWSLGVYTNNYLYFTYVQDTHYNSGTNTTTAQMIFRPDGYIVGNLSGYATSAGNADTVDDYHIAVQSSAGTNANTIYFVT